MCIPRSSRAVSRCALILGIISICTLLFALASTSWLVIKEPAVPPNSVAPQQHNTVIPSSEMATVTVKIGLFKICPTVKKINNTIPPAIHVKHAAQTNCIKIRYSPWQELRPADIGLWPSLLFTANFVSRMRACTPFVGSALILLVLATFFAGFGHFKQDSKTLVACGLFVVTGLSLGGALLVFASVLSDAYWERPLHTLQSLGSSVVQVTHGASGINPIIHEISYRYGWAFFMAAASLILAKLAAVMSITAYLRRFPSVEDMVRVTVPGGERRLRERQRLSSERLLHPVSKYTNLSQNMDNVRISPNLNKNNDIHILNLENRELLLNKSAPDVCGNEMGLENSILNAEFSTYGHISQFNTLPEYVNTNLPNYNDNVIKNRIKFGTLPHNRYIVNSEAGTSSSASSISNYSTLQMSSKRNGGMQGAGAFPPLLTSFSGGPTPIDSGPNTLMPRGSAV